MSTKQPLKYREIRLCKRWVVVIFTETNDYSVVPLNWLISPTMFEVTLLNITIVQYCRWPPYNVTSIELLEAEDPDDLWNSFKIKIVDDKIYANFKDAQHKRVEIEISAKKDECEAQKKLSKKRQKSSSEDNSDYEGSSYSFYF
eukprot:XP_016663058.1 PREDICTED: uncharacterized protein LOC107884770 [Acyrthosiphon pisum]